MGPDDFDHRSVEAMKGLVALEEDDAGSFFPGATVLVRVSEDRVPTRDGQLLLSSLLNQLFRFNRLLHGVHVDLPRDAAIQAGTHIPGDQVLQGVIGLRQWIRPHPTLRLADASEHDATVVVHIGDVDGDADVTLSADDWTAFVNGRTDARASRFPFGPLLASGLGAAEVFKQLLEEYHPEYADGKVQLADGLVFSALDPGASEVPDVNADPEAPIDLGETLLAGLGGGGSAALYALTCVPDLTGLVRAADPETLSESNGNRYLYAGREALVRADPKAASADAFVEGSDTNLRFEGHEARVQTLIASDEVDPEFTLAMVDDVPSRRHLQREIDGPIVDAGVGDEMGYSLLRVYPGEGRCIGCEHPYDDEERFRRASRRWGLTMEEARRAIEEDVTVTRELVHSLAEAQQRDPAQFEDLVGRSFESVHTDVECGDWDQDLRPGYDPTLPFLTAVPGFLAAAEVVKHAVYPDHQLENSFRHNLLWIPKESQHRFREARDVCSVDCQGREERQPSPPSGGES
jgi:hypothetical protein